MTELCLAALFLGYARPIPNIQGDLKLFGDKEHTQPAHAYDFVPVGKVTRFTAM